MHDLIFKFSSHFIITVKLIRMMDVLFKLRYLLRHFKFLRVTINLQETNVGITVTYRSPNRRNLVFIEEICYNFNQFRSKDCNF